MTDEHRLAVRIGGDCGVDRSNDVADVNERICAVAVADERQHAERCHAEQRQHRSIARSVDDTGTEDRPTKPVDLLDGVLTGELAAPVWRHRVRRIAFDPRIGCGCRPRCGEAGDVNKTCAGVPRGDRDDARGIDVHRDELSLVDRRHDTCEVHDDIDAAKGRRERRVFERRLRPDDRPDVDASRREVLDEISADEAARAGDRNAHHAVRVSVTTPSRRSDSVCSIVRRPVRPAD